MITWLISAGVLLILLCCAWLIFITSHQRFNGDKPVSKLAFFAIIFTAGLDGGFILLPLLEFSQYQTQADYSFTNALAIEVGFWGITVWLLYFVSTLYFCSLEPKLQFFQRTWVKVIHSGVVLLTCAFTLSLFLQSVNQYLDKLLGTETNFLGELLVVAIVVFAIATSTKIKFMELLSQVSVLLFIILIVMLATYTQFGADEAKQSAELVADYFINLPKFILPFNDYHEFYIAWWLTWTFMLGQFVSTFVKNMSPLMLLSAMVILPLIPTAIWFSVLFHWHEQQIQHASYLNVLMIIAAALFVINSLDFMVANYSRSLRLNVESFAQSWRGKVRFITVNVTVLLLLTYLFQSQLLLVNYVALVVIALVCCIVTNVVVLFLKNSCYFSKTRKIERQQ